MWGADFPPLFLLCPDARNPFQGWKLLEGLAITQGLLLGDPTFAKPFIGVNPSQQLVCDPVPPGYFCRIQHSQSIYIKG